MHRFSGCEVRAARFQSSVGFMRCDVVADVFLEHGLETTDVNGGVERARRVEDALLFPVVASD